MNYIIAAVAIFFLSAAPAMATDSTRFFIAGDGAISLVDAKSGATAEVRYRLSDATYDPQALARIDRVFRVPKGSSERISLRLIALLDHLQDHFKDHFKDHFRTPTIRIVSGYRSPEYNEKLRRRGALAVRTSLHLEGMAADIEMPGVDAKKLWEYARGLGCCGAGYYHGGSVHIDTGPNRFWDEKTTGAEKDLGSGNRLILLRTDQDIYFPGESVGLMIARITDYPLEIRREARIDVAGRSVARAPLKGVETDCLVLKDRRAARSIAWEIPPDITPSSRASLTIDLCKRPFEGMPESITSNGFDIKNQVRR